LSKRGPERIARSFKLARKGARLGKKIYVGNLPFTSSEDELRALFTRHGSVDSVSVVTDRETGRPRGFAFVEMSDANAAADAIKALDGTQLGGRALRVNEAQDRRAGGGDRGFGGGGGGGFRGGRR
jgi:RNA recognition motif-containing protein